MAISNVVCRNVLDTQSVVKEQIVNILAVELVARGEVKEDVYKNLKEQITKCIDDQTNSLIDRILNEFQR